MRVERAGNEFIARTDDLEVLVTKVREESRGGIQGMMRAYYLNGSRFIVGPPTWANLLTDQGRKAFTSALSTGRPVPQMDTESWRGLVNAICTQVTTLWEEGEPFVDLLDTDEPDDWDHRYLFEPMVPQGEATIVFSDGGGVKSTLAATLGLSHLTGREVIPGLRPTAAGPVMLLDWESNEREHRRRLRSLCRGYGIPERLTDYLYRSNYRALTDDLAVFQAEIKRRGVTLVIVDSAVPASGDEIKETVAAKELFAGLRSFGDGVTKLVLAHMSKAEADREQGRARVMGTIQYENQARSVWESRLAEVRRRNERVVGYYHRKVNGGDLEDPFAVRVLYDAETRQPYRYERVELRDYPELRDRLPVRDRLRDFLSGGARTTSDVADFLGATVASTQRLLKRRGDVVQVRQGGGRGNASLWGLPAGDDVRPPTPLQPRDEDEDTSWDLE